MDMTTKAGQAVGSSNPTIEGNGSIFPRGTGLPTQSPLFWVENKDRFLRQLLIKDIEALTNRRFGVYFGLRTLNSQINQGDVDRLYEVIQDLDTGPFDLLVETRGGETDAAEAMISVLMQTKHPFRAIIPNRAKSNGTLICLAAECLMMGPTSELGPIEPMVQKNIPASALLDIVSDGDQELDVARFHAKHAMDQTKQVAKRALRHKMCADPAAFSDDDLTEIIDALCGRTRFPSHGSVIDATQAAELRLRVQAVDKTDPVWERVWLLYCMLRHDAELRNLQKVFETRKVSMSVVSGLF